MNIIMLITVGFFIYNCIIFLRARPSVYATLLPNRKCRKHSITIGTPITKIMVIALKNEYFGFSMK